MLTMLCMVSVFATPVVAQAPEVEFIASGNSWVQVNQITTRGPAVINVDLTLSGPGFFGTVKFGFGTMDQMQDDAGENWWYGWIVTQVSESTGKLVLVCTPDGVVEGQDINGPGPVTIVIRMSEPVEGKSITFSGYNFHFSGKITAID